ncbi:ATP synthase f chain, mitochondrial precursor [Tulasnella sp. 418]|nr:ATP synthase f chain, mitochondrial precursor [Tulasnella sp. 418]
MRSTAVRRALNNLVPPKIATPSSVSSGGTSATTSTVVDFYSKLPKGPLPQSTSSGIRAKYFDGKNASGGPFLATVVGIFLFGYTLDYHMHLSTYCSMLSGFFGTASTFLELTRMLLYRAPQEPPTLNDLELPTIEGIGDYPNEGKWRSSMGVLSSNPVYSNSIQFNDPSFREASLIACMA